MKTLIVGNGGREAAIAWKMADKSQLFAFMAHENPSIIGFVENSNGEWQTGDILNGKVIAEFAKKNNIDLAFVSSDAPLEAGVVDSLTNAGIKTVGPNRRAAQIEWDKEFSRSLIQKTCPEFNPEYYIAYNKIDIIRIIRNFENRDFAIKPGGLTGGKGVKVTGINIAKNDSYEYALELLNTGHTAVIFEEKIEGVEFTIQAITDGNTVILPPATYDYPYRYDGDAGPGTGGMGVYTNLESHLPFMEAKHYEQASEIIHKIIKALADSGRNFNGVLNAGFFLTTEGVLKIIEFNARFGDPECMNIMCLIQDECDWVDILNKIAEGKLKKSDIYFKKQASVLVYLVAPEYACNKESPTITGYSFDADLHAINDMGCKAFVAGAVAGEKTNQYKTIGISRSIAVIATADNIEEARKKTLLAIEKCISGSLEYRRDIGSSIYIERTVNFIREGKC